MSISAWTELDDKSVKVARALALDAVESAGHGHPGTAMALAPVAHLLFNKFMNHSPENPEWFARDRFILSCGHASMLLYSQLFLNGYGLEIDDLKNFRKMNSLTPGHPEFQHTKGVEMTTGPLGQGLSSAVGMAIASRYWRNYFDAKTAPNQSIFDNYVYVVASDGDLQEGVTSEASSLAGHLGLANLIVIYDDNRISIDGDTNLAFTEDVVARYRSYNWDVHTVELGTDGQVDISALSIAIEYSRKTDKPSFFKLKTIIVHKPETTSNKTPNNTSNNKTEIYTVGAEISNLTKIAKGDYVEINYLMQGTNTNSEIITERGYLIEKNVNNTRNPTITILKNNDDTDICKYEKKQYEINGLINSIYKIEKYKIYFTSQINESKYQNYVYLLYHDEKHYETMVFNKRNSENYIFNDNDIYAFHPYIIYMIFIYCYMVIPVKTESPFYNTSLLKYLFALI